MNQWYQKLSVTHSSCLPKWTAKCFQLTNVRGAGWVWMEERFSVAYLSSGASNPSAVEQNPRLSTCSVTTYCILGHGWPIVHWGPCMSIRFHVGLQFSSSSLLLIELVAGFPPAHLGRAIPARGLPFKGLLLSLCWGTGAQTFSIVLDSSVLL